MDDLTGKVAVITGGARGVGLGLAKAFAGQGMRLVLSDINTTTLDEAVATLRASGAEAIGVTADVSDTAAVNHLRDEAFARFGTVHVLCNNATGGGGGPFCEPIDVSVWETAMSATVYSVLRGLNAFLPRMLDQGDGHIVNTASRQGLVPSPILGSYPPAKSAVIALSEMLHAELAERGSPVGVTVLTPGGVKTEGILASLALPCVSFSPPASPRPSIPSTLAASSSVPSGKEPFTSTRTARPSNGYRNASTAWSRTPKRSGIWLVQTQHPTITARRASPEPPGNSRLLGGLPEPL
jgi:NAD(P)-dependent dehydrogenase (short-subunit alcohol dehydrogenase family)